MLTTAAVVWLQGIATAMPSTLSTRTASLMLSSVLLVAAGTVAPGAAHALTQAEFSACIARLGEQARSQGISTATLARTLETATYRERIIDADRRQPEFTDTFARYYGLRVTADQVARGRALAEQHRELLAQVSREYGVPGHYLLAFWALETNFGRFFGDIPTIDALATLACDNRRSTYFTGELMAAMRLVQRGDVEPASMRGSWAGAMGHTQFMPSNYLRWAVDGDGDGRVDLWNSVPDAMASAANFLRGIGWQTGERWGREVSLPENFDYTLAGRSAPRPLSEWQQLGVRSVEGRVLPGADMRAALLVPAGHRGPKFLVYDNFQVIMRWNRSEFFALTVGLLADSIAGAQGLRNAPPADAPRLSRDQVNALQQRLNALGFDAGTPDGILGPGTRGAIRDFQHSRGWIADGYPDVQVIAALEVNTE
jgi:membrane-bound lytic murein transglycosylase B